MVELGTFLGAPANVHFVFHLQPGAARPSMRLGTLGPIWVDLRGARAGRGVSPNRKSLLLESWRKRWSLMGERARSGVFPRATRGRRSSGSHSEEADEEERRRRKEEIVEELCKGVNEKYGEGTVRMPGIVMPTVETVTTGVLPLDIALSGGWPKGRVVEIFGHESSGKTTLALHAIAERQRRGECVVFIDAEHALDARYAEELGVKINTPGGLIVVAPDCGEDALNIADSFLRSGTVSLIVVDSVSALVPKQEVVGDLGEGSLGTLARLMSLSLRKLSTSAAKSGCTLMFLNQIRMKIGVYGNPETTSGGNALKFHSSLRCETRNVEVLKNSTTPVGFRCRTKVVKSKVSDPYKVAEFEILFGKGVNKWAALLDSAVQMSLVKRRSSFYTLGNDVVQGREKACTFLQEHPELSNQLEAAVRAKITDPGSELHQELDEDPDLTDESDPE